MSRWRRQQRKRARRNREVAWLDAELAKDFSACCKAIDEGLAQLREMTIRFEVSAFEARIRRESDEARKVG